MNYDFKATEQKWQQKWDEAKVFEAQDNSDKPKFYGLVEFPYPSGAGMHVGHIKAYSGLEVVSRKRRRRKGRKRLKKLMDMRMTRMRAMLEDTRSLIEQHL